MKLDCRRFTPTNAVNRYHIGLTNQPSASEPGSAKPVPVTLPYGIAIAVGGVAVVIELMKS